MPTRVKSFIGIRGLKFKVMRDEVWISRASENPGDACSELHHNAEEERSTKTTIPRRELRVLLGLRNSWKEPKPVSNF